MDDSLPDNQRVIVSFEQRIAIDAYVSNANGEVELVRRVQQGEYIGVDQEKYMKMSKEIEAFIARNHTENDILYRGVKLTDSELKKYRAGFVFDQFGTSSWSPFDGVALEFVNRKDIPGIPVMFRAIDVTRAANIESLSLLNEAEWLYSKDQKFRVIQDPYRVYIREIWSNVWIVDVEEFQ